MPFFRALIVCVLLGSALSLAKPAARNAAQARQAVLLRAFIDTQGIDALEEADLEAQANKMGLPTSTPSYQGVRRSFLALKFPLAIGARVLAQRHSVGTVRGTSRNGESVAVQLDTETVLQVFPREALAREVSTWDGFEKGTLVRLQYFGTYLGKVQAVFENGMASVIYERDPAVYPAAIKDLRKR